MTNTETSNFIEPIPFVEEKGDVEHAIRCTKQAEERARSPWLKEACTFRLKMLRAQLSKQKQMQNLNPIFGRDR